MYKGHKKADTKMKCYYPVFTEWIYEQEHLIYFFLKLL